MNLWSENNQDDNPALRFENKTQVRFTKDKYSFKLINNLIVVSLNLSQNEFANSKFIPTMKIQWAK